MFLHMKFHIFFCVNICYSGSVNIGCQECGMNGGCLKKENIIALHSQSLTVDLKSRQNQNYKGTCGI